LGAVGGVLVSNTEAMRYEISKDFVYFYIDSPTKNEPRETKYSREGTQLPEQSLRAICEATVRKAQSWKHGSQQNILYMFYKPLHIYLSVGETEFPKNSQQWQKFLLDFYSFYLTSTTWSDAWVKTRLSMWQCLVQGIFEFLIRERIIPRDVRIPTANHNTLASRARDQALLGQQDVTTIEPGEEVSKILVSVDFGRTNADFLENIEQQCRQKVALIKTISLNHWNALMNDGLVGESLAAEISPSELAEAISTGGCSKRFRGGPPTPLSSPTQPRGLQWALALTQHFLLTGNQLECISTDTLSKSRYFPAHKPDCFRFEQLTNFTSMPASAFFELVSPVRFGRFAGILSVVDVAAACCLLTIEHPQFTADSLHSAKLLNAKGQSYLLLTDDSNRKLFSVDKPRAGSRKIVALTPLAQKIVHDVIAWTAGVRNVLKRASDKRWRYLFLGYGRGGALRKLTPYAHHLWDPLKVSLSRLYPEIRQGGLTEGTFDFRRIRTTMGVLRWFETGSVLEMSKTLGNTTKVVLENYLPLALLHAWNSRIIRRFQNTLIVLAVSNEPYLLEVTDFTSISDLQHFLAQLLLEYPNRSSPLANELHSRFGQVTPSASGTHLHSCGEALLNVRLSAQSLGYLYAFSDFAVSLLSATELTQVDLQTNLQPQQFVDLARLIHHACESEEIAASLREILDVTRLREVHSQAKEKQVEIQNKLKTLSIKNQWESECV
jgi:hypothetical protein